MPFFDSHAHIQGEEYESDLEETLRRGSEAGVTRIVVPAVDLATARGAIALAEAHEGIYATAGYHPHEASSFDDEVSAAVEGLLAHEKIVAVGELGLDYYYMHSPREAQLEALEKQLDLAARHDLPIVVHCRDAWDDMAAVVGPWARGRRGAHPVGVMHYFSGTLEQARFYIDLGFMISVHTSVTHKKAEGLRAVIADLPTEAFVIETDSPYGAPQAYRGKRNEPAYVVEAAKQIAELHGVTLEAVAEATTANARRLFRLPVAASVK